MEFSGPSTLRERSERQLVAWSISPERTIETATSMLVFGRREGQPVVLKVLNQPGDEWHAGRILAAFGGRGTVRVLEHTGGAMLLEHLLPAEPLVNLTLTGRDAEATEVFAGVVSSMTPTRGSVTAPEVADWGLGFERYPPDCHALLPQDLVGQAQGVYQSLCRTQRTPRLLHGDLHHYNVLRDAERGWVAIDPKGVIGEVEFELGAVLRNPVGHPAFFTDVAVVQRRLAQLHSLLGIDPRRALAWAFAQGVLSAIWSIEDGEPLDESHAGLALARALCPIVMGPG